VAWVRFTRNLDRLVTVRDVEVSAGTVAAALDVCFRENPGVARYVLDDQGALRKHVVVFVNGEQIRDRSCLSDVVSADDQIYVMQALSGG
jgi:molybdopterin synthase sulfur carrier subunit